MAARLMYDLRPRQLEALAAIHAARERGVRRQVIVAPTGFGKTVLFARLIRDLGQRALVLAHREELVDQAIARIRRDAPELAVGKVQGTRNQVHAQVVVASVQTLARPQRLQQVLEAANKRTRLFGAPLGPLGLVVADECHHYVQRNTFGKVLRDLGSHDEHGPLVVGFTATPHRHDRHGLASMWDEIVYRCTLADGVSEGWLARPRVIQVQLAVDMTSLHVGKTGDYLPAELEAALREADAPHHVVRAYLEHATGRKALVFCPTRAAARDMAAAFAEAGLRFEAIDGASKDRAEKLTRFAQGEVVGLCNPVLLTEGFDAPDVSCVIVARPTLSLGLCIQMIGRGLRTHAAKDDCVILDCVGVSQRHDIVQNALTLQTDKPIMPAPKPVLLLGGAELAPPEEEPDEPEQLELDEARAEQGELVYREVDVFGRSPYAWVQTTAGQWVLSMGAAAGSVILAQRSPGAWDVVREWRVEGQRQRAIVARGLAFEAARSDAEARVERAGATSAARRDARWRLSATTTAQQAALLARGLPVPARAGEASDLLSAHLTRAV